MRKRIIRANFNMSCTLKDRTQINKLLNKIKATNGKPHAINLIDALNNYGRYSPALTMAAVEAYRSDVIDTDMLHNEMESAGYTDPTLFAKHWIADKINEWLKSGHLKNN